MRLVKSVAIIAGGLVVAGLAVATTAQAEFNAAYPDMRSLMRRAGSDGL